jgi:hypothetical protein
MESSGFKQNTILLVSGSCCFPKMAITDKKAQQVIEQALEETGVAAIIKVITATGLLQGGVPAEIMKEFGSKVSNESLMRLPAILINGKLKFWGVPELTELKAILNTLNEGIIS